VDTLFHFLFPIIAALASRVHLRHPLRSILLAGIITVLIDVDHFVGIGLERALFHNIFVTFLIPAVLLILSFRFRTSKYVKGFFVLLLIFLSSHLFLDLFTEGPGVALLFPFDTTYYAVNFCLNVPVTSQFVTEACMASSFGVGLFLFFVIIVLPCYYIDEIIEHIGKSRKKAKR